MPRHLICDVHEWINEIPTVPICRLAKPQPREWAWQIKRGKKTLLSLTLIWICGVTRRVENTWELRQQWNTTTSDVVLLTPFCWNAFWVFSGRRRFCVDHNGGHFQTGSLAGAAHLLKWNADALRWTQGEQKSPVDRKGKCSLDSDVNCV